MLLVPLCVYAEPQREFIHRNVTIEVSSCMEVIYIISKLPHRYPQRGKL